MAFVWVKLVSDAPLRRGGAFAKVPLDSTIVDVFDVRTAACASHSHWGFAADELELYLAAEDSDDGPTDDTSRVALSGAPLRPDWSLGRARIGPGSWLLARVVPQPPAAAAASSPDLAIVMRAMRIEAALPTIEVRLWSRPGVFSAKVDASFDFFRAGVVAAACRGLSDARAAKLYFFCGAVQLSERIAITDDATLAVFMSAPNASAVWVFLPVDGGVPSPDMEPAADAASAPSAQTVRSGRSSVLQGAFRTALLRRDGSACVLCERKDSPGKSCLESAHVVAVRTPALVRDACGLLDSFEPQNGVVLCADCHHEFDQHLWHVDEHNNAVIADALIARAGSERWALLRGRALRVPVAPFDAQWPPWRYWHVQKQLFHAALAERHAVVDESPFRAGVKAL